MELQRLDHVSLNVTDRTRSVDWYRDVLGLPQLNQPTEDDQPLSSGQPGLQFGLFQSQRQSPAREPESSGLRRIAIVERCTPRRARPPTLARARVQIEDHGNALSVYFNDPDGHVLEVDDVRSLAAFPFTDEARPAERVALLAFAVGVADLVRSGMCRRSGSRSLPSTISWASSASTAALEPTALPSVFVP